MFSYVQVNTLITSEIQVIESNMAGVNNERQKCGSHVICRTSRIFC